MVTLQAGGWCAWMCASINFSTTPGSWLGTSLAASLATALAGMIVLMPSPAKPPACTQNVSRAPDIPARCVRAAPSSPDRAAYKPDTPVISRVGRNLHGQVGTA